jgi:hypothetical protein
MLLSVMPAMNGRPDGGSGMMAGLGVRKRNWKKARSANRKNEQLHETPGQRGSEWRRENAYSM